MNERLGLPSASSRARDSRCPGALNFIRALLASGAKLDDGAQPWTESGTRIHDASTGEEIDLDHNETLSLETVQERLQTLREALNVPDDAEEVIERRFWLRDGLRKIASGKPDRIWRFGDTSVIPDIKTGWGEVEPEESNLQYQSYAVLEYVNRSECRNAVVATISAHGKRPHPVIYNESKLRLAEQIWRSEIFTNSLADAPRVAGPIQCKYCPAKLHCDKAQAVVPEMATLTIYGAGLVVSNEDLAALLDKCGHAKKMIGEIEAEAKRRLANDPEALSGWELDNGKEKSSISDLTTVFNRCLEKGVTAEQFTAGCSITKKNLTEALKTATKQKGKALDGVVKEVVEGCTSSKTTVASLKRKQS